MANFKRIAKNSQASQGHNELEWLLNKVDSIKPSVILEIGVHQGFSCQTWKQAFKPKLLIGVDHERHDLKYEDFEFVLGDSHSITTKLVVQQLMGRYGVNEVDFLFIDGDHMYDGVKKDFEMYAPLVRKGGIIAFDDMDLFDNPSVEVHMFWKNIKDEYAWLMSHDDSNGIGIIYV